MSPALSGKEHGACHVIKSAVVARMQHLLVPLFEVVGVLASLADTLATLTSDSAREGGSRLRLHRHRCLWLGLLSHDV